MDESTRTQTDPSNPILIHQMIKYQYLMHQKRSKFDAKTDIDDQLDDQIDDQIDDQVDDQHPYLIYQPIKYQI